MGLPNLADAAHDAGNAAQDAGHAAGNAAQNAAQGTADAAAAAAAAAQDAANKGTETKNDAAAVAHDVANGDPNAAAQHARATAEHIIKNVGGDPAAMADKLKAMPGSVRDETMRLAHRKFGNGFVQAVLAKLDIKGHSKQAQKHAKDGGEKAMHEAARVMKSDHDTSTDVVNNSKA